MAITITVAGEAELRHTAELATVSLTLGFEGPVREEVLRRSTQLHGEVTAEVEALHSPASGPVTEWASEQLRVWGQRPWNQNGEQLPVVFHSAASVTATFTDFAGLSSWVSTISLVSGVTVNGIDWTLSDETRRELDGAAQRDAVAAAVTKAKNYAASLGFADVVPVAVSDAGLLGDPDRPMPMVMAMRSALGERHDADATEFKPEKISIKASVQARFSAS